MTKFVWTPELVIAAIRERDEKKQALLSGQVNLEMPGLWRAAKRLFQTWQRAISAAGLDYDQISRTQRKDHGGAPPPIYSLEKIKPVSVGTASREELLAIISRICLQGETPYRWGTEKTPIYIRACEEFGTWEDAVAAAGFDYSIVVRRNPPNPTGEIGLQWWLLSLDAPRFHNSEATLADFVSEPDPGFEQFEARDLLHALLNKRKLAKEMAGLLERVLLGYDLEDDEYELLAMAIRGHPELAKLLEAI
jgi:hypothetical protein